MKREINGKPLITVSPTFFKTHCDCPRKAYLDSMKDEPNIHFAYGHAYGHSAAQLFIYRNEPKEVRLGAAYVALRSYSQPFEGLVDPPANKSIATLVSGLRATDYMVQQLCNYYDYVDEEVKLILIVKFEDGTKGVISGTYDIKLNNNLSGRSNIFDFKAVTSDYLYSWNTDPQVPIYTVMNQVVANLRGTGEEYEHYGKYLVHHTKDGGDLFSTRDIDPYFWKNTMQTVLSRFLQLAKTEGQRLGAHEYVEDLVFNLNTNTYVCNKNEYRCSYFRDCHEKDFDVAGREDTRRPTDVITMEVDEADVWTAYAQIASRIAVGTEVKTDPVNPASQLQDVSLTELEADLYEKAGTLDDLDSMFDEEFL